MDTFFVSTPIYYVNAEPHLGHAYTTIVADAIARFYKLNGSEVFFLTGTDEHGDKIVQAAAKKGKTSQEYVDEISSIFKNLWPGLEIDYSYFIRTTHPKHIQTVQKFLQKVYDNGDIYFGEYGGYYCFGCERFYTEKELTPDGLCPDHLTKPTFLEEKNYFFKMSKYLKALREHIENNPNFIWPERYKREVLGLLKEDLGDLCISRPKSRLKWGIELPFDKNFVTYVWFDALINYITALDWPDGEKFQKFWPNSYHIVAKDILKPHAIFWPTMLIAAGLPLYKGLRVHGYWTVDETKMSKSLGNVIKPLELKDKYGLPAFRYFLLREMQFGLDANFSEQSFVTRLNADLANDLGNLFSRVLTMTNKYFQGQVPEPKELTDEDHELLQVGLSSCSDFQNLFARFTFSKALDSLWVFIRHLNKYVDTTAPWLIAKQGDLNRLQTVIYNLLEGLRKVAIHLWPVMPSKSELMLKQLGVKFNLEKVELLLETKTWGLLPTGVKVAQKSNLFPREEVKKINNPEPQSKPEYISFEEFKKLDLRVGTILDAKIVKGSDKLLALKIDVGERKTRQIISGIANYFKPQELINKQVVVIVNLKPRKIFGLVSEGMVLAASFENDLSLLHPDKTMPAGTKIS
ncbi:MAG: methionine--tRNA ligase [Desulfonauticus sp.]|nr:methionine--tRNA ligase [Desulfonauticus sp.]